MAGTLSPRRRNERPVTHVGATVGGRYHLESVLGAGAMGTVFAARHTVLDRAVALKVVSSALVGDPRLTDSLLDEARATARVTHPNLVQVFDAGVDDATGDIFLAMERLEGETLRALLDRRGALPPREVVALVAPLLDALDVAHAAGTVHRDVKPDNVLVARAPDGSARPTLIDFGVARVLARSGLHDAVDDDAALGTPAYMSPEQRRAPAAVDARADLWSVAVVLAEALTGRAPRPDAAPDVTDVPAPLRDVLARALHHDPSRRFADARSLRDALRDAVTPPPRRRGGVAAALSALLLAAGLAASLRAPSPAPPPRQTSPRPIERPPAPAAPTPPRIEAPAAPPAPAPPPAPAAAAPTVVRRAARRAAPSPAAPSSPPPAPRPWFEPRSGSLRAP